MGAQYMDEVLEGSRTASNSMGTDVEPILRSSERNERFKKLRTVIVASIHLFISVVISFVGIALVLLWEEERGYEANFIMITLRVFFWILTSLYDNFIRKLHNDVRMNGFHDFHRSVVLHNGMALNIVSAWNTLLLLLQAVLHYNGTESWSMSLKPVIGTLCLQVVETLALMIVHGIYIAKVYKFNKNANYPDALIGTNSPAGSLGLMQPGGNVAELLEKQADLIAYLKDHNRILNQKLHHLQALIPRHLGD